MRNKCTHTHFHQGTKIYIILRSGEHVTGKYKETKRGRILFSDRDYILTKDIRTAGIAKYK